jgi:hypothetical protein
MSDNQLVECLVNFEKTQSVKRKRDDDRVDRRQEKLDSTICCVTNAEKLINEQSKRLKSTFSSTTFYQLVDELKEFRNCLNNTIDSLEANVNQLYFLDGCLTM